MAVNLVPQVGRETAREILETSFAQFQADRAVVGMAGTVRRNEKALEGYAEAMTCHLGDFPSYAAIRNSIRDLEKEASKARSASRRAEAELSLEKLRPGDIIKIPAGRRSGYAVVIQGNRGGKGEGAAPTVLTADGQVRRLTLVDVPTPVDPITHVQHPQGASTPATPSRGATSPPPCGSKVPHEPPPEPARADRRWRRRTSGSPSCAARCGPTPATSAPTARTTPAGPSGGGGCRRETDGIAAQGRRPHQLGGPHLRPDLRPAGRDGLPVRRRHRGHRRRGRRCAGSTPRRTCWRPSACATASGSRLDPAGLAAAVSMLVHEPRRDEGELSPRMPGDEVVRRLHRRWCGSGATLEDREHAHGLPLTGEPDGGMAWMMHRWASGQRLEAVLQGQRDGRR